MKVVAKHRKDMPQFQNQFSFQFMKAEPVASEYLMYNISYTDNSAVNFDVFLHYLLYNRPN